MIGSITTWFGRRRIGELSLTGRVISWAHHLQWALWPAVNPQQVVLDKGQQDRGNPNNRLLGLLWSGKCLNFLRANTKRIKRSFFQQVIRTPRQFSTYCVFFITNLHLIYSFRSFPIHILPFPTYIVIQFCCNVIEILFLVHLFSLVYSFILIFSI